MHTRKARVKFVTLPSRMIYNECGPNSADRKGLRYVYEQELNECGKRYVAAMNQKNGFYEKLEASILQEGIRNPIIVNAGWCPDSKRKQLPSEMAHDDSKILICNSVGGSRLWIAQKHNLVIPCIINDFCNRFTNTPMITTKEQVAVYFKDQPDRINFTEYGVTVYKVPQTHMEEDNE